MPCAELMFRVEVFDFRFATAAERRRRYAADASLILIAGQ